jgi:hypothetical protein
VGEKERLEGIKRIGKKRTAESKTAPYRNMSE